MRGLSLFFGSHRRNDPIWLNDPHPVTNYGNDLEHGDAGRDGCTVLSRANPDRQGTAPSVPGVIGPAYQGPADDWEQ